MHGSLQNVIWVGEDEYLIYNLGTGKLHRLNPTAALVFELCCAGKDSDEIARILAPVLGKDKDSSVDWIQYALDQQLLIAELSGQQASPAELAAHATKLRDEGEVLAAYVCQENAATSEPGNSDYWLQLGELAHILGRREAAKEAYHTYLKLVPENAEVRHLCSALQDEVPPSRAPDACIKQLYSRFAEFYEKNMCEELNYAAPQRVGEVLAEFLPEARDLSILELGCGTGLAGEVVHPLAAQLIGIDLSPDMIGKCKAREIYTHLQQEEITSFLHQNRETFDLILACDTLIYFGELRQVFKPAYSHLNDGGHLLVTVEKGTKQPFSLMDSGRYAHTAGYLSEVGADCGFQEVVIREGFLRHEYGNEVTGLVALFSKNPSSD